MTKPLSKETKAQMVQDYANGMNLIKVGDKYGVSHETIRKYVKKMGVLRRVGKPGGLTPEQCKEVKDRYEKGDSLGIIAREYGVGPETVRRMITLHGGKMRSASTSIKTYHARKAMSQV